MFLKAMDDFRSPHIVLLGTRDSSSRNTFNKDIFF